MPVCCNGTYVLCGHRQASCISIGCVILINIEVGYVLLVCLVFGLFLAAIN
jgi:Ni,Fe-hydrogenase I cytochrome b subunit